MTEKNDLVVSEMVRGMYIVSQANDLAKAFGKLSVFEHQILDYCISYIKKNDEQDTAYTATIPEILSYLGLERAGSNYKRLGVALKKLKHETPLLLPIYKNDDPNEELLGVSLSELFEEIKVMKSGEVTFVFSKRARPLIFDLKKKFYTFRLEELSKLKSKYSLILLKLWASYRRKTKVRRQDDSTFEEWKRETVISAPIEDWQVWLLGEGKRMEPSQFKRDCIMKGLDELNKQDDFEASIRIIKKGRKVAGYEMTIVSDRGNNKTTIEGEATAKPATQAPESNVETLDQFFETFKKATGVSATKGQKTKTKELADVFNADERLPILNFAQKLFVEYGGKTFSYLLKVVEQWSEAGLNTLADVETFYNAEKTGTKAVKEPETNIPHWSSMHPDNADKQENNILAPDFMEKLIETQIAMEIFDKPEGIAEREKRQKEIDEALAKRAELEAKKWELLGRPDTLEEQE